MKIADRLILGCRVHGAPEKGSSSARSLRLHRCRAADYAVAPSFTETSFETPGSCMVTP
jgi:hypothetical protein